MELENVINNLTTENPENQLILFLSKKKLIGYATLFFACGIATLLAGIDGASEAFIGSVICWAGFAGFLAKLSNNTPQIVIGEKGIVDNQRKIFIEWKDVTEIWVRHVYRSHYYICMNFKNPEKYRQQMSSVQRVIWKPDEWAGHGHMNIGFIGLDKSTDDVWFHIHKLKSSGYISAPLKISETSRSSSHVEVKGD